MSMEEKTTLDVLRECKYRYISSVLSRPYMEDISGYWLIHCQFTCVAQISLKHQFPFEKANFLKFPSQNLFSNFVLKFGCYQTSNFIHTLSHSQTWF